MVTIIIPCYNRPDDLRNALASLVAQTDKNFSVIVSDDCSVEDTRAVCDEVKDKLNITYIRKEINEGIGKNRQFALAYAKEHAEEYLMWLDSDDSLMPNAVQRLQLAISHNKADIISSDILCESNVPQQKIIRSDEGITWLHGKIYRTQYLIDKDITFPDIKTNEDLGFNLIAFALTTEIYHLNEIFYLWRDNKASITRSKATTPAQRRCQSIDYIDSIYFAFKRVSKLTSKIIGSIIHLYNFYQKGRIYQLLTPDYDKKIREMLRNRQVIDQLVNIRSLTEPLKLDQWVSLDNNLIFFQETYGQWLARFLTKEEVEAAIKRLQKKEREKEKQKEEAEQ